MFKSLLHFFQCPLFWWRGLRGRLLESQEGEGRSRVCQRSATGGGGGREEEKAAQSLCQPDSHFIQQVANQTEEAANQQKGQCKLSNRLNVRHFHSHGAVAGFFSKPEGFSKFHFCLFRLRLWKPGKPCKPLTSMISTTSTLPLHRI